MIKYVQSKPIDYDHIQKLLNRSVQAHTFTNGGPVKQLLEKRLEELFQLDHQYRVICTNNGTSALYVLMSMFEKLASKHLTWGTPAFNFPAATVNKLNTSIFDIKIEETTDFIGYLIPINIIKELNYDGYIIPSLFGTMPTNFPEFEKYCLDHNKLLIWDNASSPLTTNKESGKNINSFGSASMGSLHHTKYIGVGEGGFVVVPSEFYDLFTQLTNFGFTDDRKYNNIASNAKISDISAAFILSHIEQYSVGRHLVIQQKYIEAIKNIQGVKVFNNSPDWLIVYGNMPVCFDKLTSHLSFRDVGVEANKYYKPLKSFPNSDALFARIINLPLHSFLTDYDLSLILKKVETEAKK